MIDCLCYFIHTTSLAQSRAATQSGYPQVNGRCPSRYIFQQQGRLLFCTLASMPHEKSPAQRAIDWGKIIETTLDMPGNVGNAYNRFYNYSYANQTLLWM